MIVELWLLCCALHRVDKGKGVCLSGDDLEF